MLTFETVNELSLRVTCRGNDVLYTRTGAFIAGENDGPKNYRFEKLLLGPQQGLAAAALGSLVRRVTGENIPLTKVMMNGDSTTYYASFGRHVIIYKLAMGEVVSVESENLLAFSGDCNYSVRFIGVGIFSQKGLATTTLTGKGPDAYVAVLSNGNPIVLSNVENRKTLSIDPDAVICWFAQNGVGDPHIKTDITWKNFIGQASGESYAFEWAGSNPVSVIVQPSERKGGISVGVD